MAQHNDSPAIISYTIEPLADSLLVHVRRRLGPQAVMTLVFPGLFIAFGLFFAWGIISSSVGPIVHSSSSATKPAGKGIPICCVPFLLIFMLFFIRVPILAIKGVLNSLRGRERWLFTRSQITPPQDGLSRQQPLALGSEVRAGLLGASGRRSIGLSTQGKELQLGPFTDDATAERLLADLRQFRPGWFTEADGAPALYASTKEPQESAPPEVITHYEISLLPEGFDLLLRRSASPARRNRIPFFILWGTLWTLGGCAAAYVLAKALIALGHPNLAVEATTKPSRNSDPPILFLSLWLIGWCFGEVFGWANLILRFRTTELWQFRQDHILAGRTWQYLTRRRLPTDQPVHVRRASGPCHPGIELIAEGTALPIGPFASQQEADRFTQSLHRLRPYWHWSTLHPPQQA